MNFSHFQVHLHARDAWIEYAQTEGRTMQKVWFHRFKKVLFLLVRAERKPPMATDVLPKLSLKASPSKHAPLWLESPEPSLKMQHLEGKKK